MKTVIIRQSKTEVSANVKVGACCNIMLPWTALPIYFNWIEKLISVFITLIICSRSATNPDNLGLARRNTRCRQRTLGTTSCSRGLHGRTSAADVQCEKKLKLVFRSIDGRCHDNRTLCTVVAGRRWLVAQPDGLMAGFARRLVLFKMYRHIGERWRMTRPSSSVPPIRAW